MMTRRIRLLRENGEKVSINLDNPFLVLHRNEFSQPYVDKYRSISSLNSDFYKGLPYMEGTLVEVGGGIKPFRVLQTMGEIEACIREPNAIQDVCYDSGFLKRRAKYIDEVVAACARILESDQSSDSKCRFAEECLDELKPGWRDESPEGNTHLRPEFNP
ncbi:MAG: hypothetical protein H6863_05855 [Rhodospirillales bacterium]|nr:hypothetical protein [Rhodospirillales bacterium]